MIRDVPLLLFSMDILSAGQCAVRNGSAFIPDEAVAGDGSTSNADRRICDFYDGKRIWLHCKAHIADSVNLVFPYLHGEHTLDEDSMHFILTKEDKYIWYSQTGRELYFNLRDDPHETKNVLEENQKRVAELRALLIRLMPESREQQELPE